MPFLLIHGRCCRSSSRKQAVEYGVPSTTSAGAGLVSSTYHARTQFVPIQVALLQADTVEAAAPLILSWLSSDLGPASLPYSGNVGMERARPLLNSQETEAGTVGRSDGQVQGVVVDQDEQAMMISWNSGVLKAPRPSTQIARTPAKRGQSHGQDQPMVHMNQQGQMRTSSLLYVLTHCG